MAKNDGRVVSNFICQSLLNESITVFGNGKQTRSFCYVDDLIEGFLKIMESNFTGPINLGNPDDFKISELAEKLRNKINKDGNIIFKELPEDDPKQRKPSITLAKEVLKWEPQIALKDGLIKTIEWFKENS